MARALQEQATEQAGPHAQAKRLPSQQSWCACARPHCSVALPSGHLSVRPVLAQRMRRRGPALPESPLSLEWAVTGHRVARSFRDSKSLQLLRVRARALSCIRDLVGREVVARHYLSARRPVAPGPTREASRRSPSPSSPRTPRSPKPAELPRGQGCVPKAGVAEALPFGSCGTDDFEALRGSAKF